MYKDIINDIRNIKDLETIINYYYPNQLIKNKMKCPFHNDKTPSLQIVDKGNGAFYKCFGCQAGGDIIDFIKRVENIDFIDAVKKAYYILNKDLNLPNKRTIKLNTTNKKKINSFYENKIEEAIEYLDNKLS